MTDIIRALEEFDSWSLVKSTDSLYQCNVVKQNSRTQSGWQRTIEAAVKEAIEWSQFFEHYGIHKEEKAARDA